MHGQVGIVGLLLEYGVSIEEETIAKTSGNLLDSGTWIENLNGLPPMRPLHLAARNRQGPMARFLIESGAEVAARAGHNIQSVHLAAACGSTEVLELLVEAGAALDASCGRPGHQDAGWQPLHWAVATQNQKSIIAYLLGKGPDLEAQTPSGLHPLHAACLFYQVSNVCTVLAHYDTDVQDGQRLSVFLHATIVKAWSTVEGLLKDGVDPNCRNSNRITAIRILSSRGNSNQQTYPTIHWSIERILQSLLEHGADVDALARRGTSRFI